MLISITTPATQEAAWFELLGVASVQVLTSVARVCCLGERGHCATDVSHGGTICGPDCEERAHMK